MIKRLPRFLFLLLISTPLLVTQLPIATASSTSVSSPQNPGPCSVTTTNVQVGGVSTDVYVPVDSTCSGIASPPYPAVVFAHGFSLFGFSDGRAENQGSGEHLASWGYIVGIPTLPDDFEARAAVLISGLDFLEASTIDSGSFLYEMVDTTRLAAGGYSLGGATALAIAARDARVKAVVALDPVYHESDASGEEGAAVWDAAAEAPNIVIPAGILGAPADGCNASADHQDLYPLIGASFKASYEVVGASHCVFADPGGDFCDLTCGGSVGESLTGLSQKYMTAWFNYHLVGDASYFSYLYGPHAEADINSGVIVRQVETFPSLLFMPLIENGVH